MKQEFMIIGPDGQPKKLNSLNELMQNPLLATGMLNMVAQKIGDKWKGMESVIEDSILTIRSHAVPHNVEDVVLVFLKELFAELEPLHSSYAEAFKNDRLDYGQIKIYRMAIAHTQEKYRHGLPNELVRALMITLPSTLALNISDLGVTYQELDFFMSRITDASMQEKVVSERERYYGLTKECWQVGMNLMQESCKCAVPDAVVQRSRKENRMWKRLISEGMESTKACDEALSSVRKANTPEGFGEWLDATFGLDSADEHE